jgi:hypothetical protein
MMMITLSKMMEINMKIKMTMKITMRITMKVTMMMIMKMIMIIMMKMTNNNDYDDDTVMKMTVMIQCMVMMI